MIALLMLIIGLTVGATAVFALQDRKRQELLSQEQLQKTRSTELASLGIDLKSREAMLAQQTEILQRSHASLSAQIISYNDRVTECYSLKKELYSIYQRWRATQSDNIELEKSQRLFDSQRQALGQRFLQDHLRWIHGTLNSSNFATKKNQLRVVIAELESMGINTPPEEIRRLNVELEEQYKMAVRSAVEREEQSRITASIREEQKRDREIKQEAERIERERMLVQRALDSAMAKAHGDHTAEIAILQARLAEVESKERAISQAQLTRAGNVYVISNLGSFGDEIFKIGMTRRLEPLDRIIELGDASVPFPFDVHLMIATENAPALENALHRKFHGKRINKMNPRKEFFRVTLEEIVAEVELQYGKVTYTADAEALQYRNSLQMTEEDAALVEDIFDKEMQTAGIDEE